jgi:hypothetical protein
MGASPLMILGMLNVNLSICKNMNLNYTLTDTFPEINENYIRKHRETIPSSVYNYVAPIPELA